MIFDDIENWGTYFGRSNTFKDIFQELSSISVKKPNGVYLKNNYWYYKVMNYDTKINPSIIESHRREVDLQIILSGKEHIKIFKEQNITIAGTYDDETDCQFYKNPNKAEIEFDLIPGKMAVFFPQDIHACQYAVDDKVENIKKIVIKIDEKLFTH